MPHPPTRYIKDYDQQRKAKLPRGAICGRRTVDMVRELKRAHPTESVRQVWETHAPAAIEQWAGNCRRVGNDYFYPFARKKDADAAPERKLSFKQFRELWRVASL